MKTFKRLLAVILAIAMTFAIVSTAFAVYNFDETLPVQEIDGWDFVPIRAAANLRGLEVDWDAENHVVVLTGPLGDVEIIDFEIFGGFIEDGVSWLEVGTLNSVFMRIPMVAMAEPSRTDLWTWENFEDTRPPMFSEILPHGEMSLGFIEYINDNFYSRTPFTYREKETATWLVEELLAMGHDFDSIEVQEFAFIEAYPLLELFNTSWNRVTMPQMLGDGVARDNQLSQNVILTIPGTGETGGIIIVGAHYDTFPYPGASDNAGGMALLLESAARMMHLDNYHTIIYTWFGAEEVGLLGAYFFYDSLTDAQRDDIVMMINADVLFEGPIFQYGAGTMPQIDDEDLPELYEQLLVAMGVNLAMLGGMTPVQFFAMAGLGEAAMMVDIIRSEVADVGTNAVTAQIDAIAQAVIEEHGIEILARPSRISMGSDQLVFLPHGHTIVTLSGSAWTEDENHPDGGFFSGRVSHTPRDDFHYIEENWPGKIAEAMRTFNLLLEALLTSNFN